MLQGPTLRKSEFWFQSVSGSCYNLGKKQPVNHVKHSNLIILKIFEDSCSIPAPSPLPSLHLFQLNPSRSLWFSSFWFSLVALLWLGCSLSGLSSRYHERKIAFQVYQEMSAILSLSCILYFHQRRGRTRPAGQLRLISAFLPCWANPLGCICIHPAGLSRAKDLSRNKFRKTSLKSLQTFEYVTWTEVPWFTCMQAQSKQELLFLHELTWAPTGLLPLF